MLQDVPYSDNKYPVTSNLGQGDGFTRLQQGG